MRTMRYSFLPQSSVRKELMSKRLSGFCDECISYFSTVCLPSSVCSPLRLTSILFLVHVFTWHTSLVYFSAKRHFSSFNLLVTSSSKYVMASRVESWRRSGQPFLGENSKRDSGWRWRCNYRLGENLRYNISYHHYASSTSISLVHRTS